MPEKKRWLGSWRGVKVVEAEDEDEDVVEDVVRNVLPAPPRPER